MELLPFTVISDVVATAGGAAARSSTCEPLFANIPIFEASSAVVPSSSILPLFLIAAPSAPYIPIPFIMFPLELVSVSISP